MAWDEQTSSRIERLRLARRQLASAFVGRDEAVDAVALAAACGENVLLLGPPGTAKSELARRFAALVQARHFEYLLTRFTEPSELFGPPDLAALQASPPRYRIVTEGMLPEAEVAFLDEVWKGSSAILNTLLALVHERIFHDGSERRPVPLLVLIAASNAPPDDESLRALHDRFLLRVALDPVPDDRLGLLLDRGWALEAAKGAARAAPLLAAEDLRALQSAVGRVRMDAVRPEFEAVVREARAEGIALSDRRAVKFLKAVAGAALLDGRDEARIRDLWPFRHACDTRDEVPRLHAILAPRLAADGGPALEAQEPLDRLEGRATLLERQLGGARHEPSVLAVLRGLGDLRRRLLSRAGGGEARDALLARVDALVERAMEALERGEEG